jgi:hypothetical protein
LRTITRQAPPRPEPGPPLRGLSTVVVDIAPHYAEVPANGGARPHDRTSVCLKVHLTTQDSYALDFHSGIANQSGDWIAIAPHLHSIDPRLAKALSNDVRARALRLIVAGPKSPKAIGVELGLDVRGVAYHVRVLKRLGCVELVETQHRRGAVEHIYRAADWVLDS